MMGRDKNGTERLGRAVTDWFELPQDLVLDLPRIILLGRNEITIENHHGIIECTEERMRINLSRGYLEIQGTDLQIRSLYAEELQLIGQIEQLRFVE